MKGQIRSVGAKAFITGLCFMAAMAQVAPGQQTRPAPTTNAAGPATRPALREFPPLPSEPGTPRDALKLFAAALRDGDEQRLRRVVILGNEPADGRMLNAIARMAAALARMNQAAVDAWGESAISGLTGDSLTHFERTLARIDAADISIDGEKATVRYADAKDAPFELRRVGGLWKVPMGELSQGADPATLDQRLAELDGQAQIVAALTGEIAAGKFHNADAAREAWRVKIMRSLSDHPGDRARANPATRPTTQAGA